MEDFLQFFNSLRKFSLNFKFLKIKIAKIAIYIERSVNFIYLKIIFLI